MIEVRLPDIEQAVDATLMIAAVRSARAAINFHSTCVDVDLVISPKHARYQFELAGRVPASATQLAPSELLAQLIACIGREPRADKFLRPKMMRHDHRQPVQIVERQLALARRDHGQRTITMT